MKIKERKLQSRLVKNIKYFSVHCKHIEAARAPEVVCRYGECECVYLGCVCACGCMWLLRITEFPQFGCNLILFNTTSAGDDRREEVRSREQ